MKNILLPHLSSQRQLQWPEVLALCLFAMPLLVLGLQFSVPQLSPLWVMCLDVSVFIGCALIFSAGIVRGVGRFRWSTICCAISMIGSALVQLLAINVTIGLVSYEQVSSLQQNLIIFAYILGLAAIAMSFPRRFLLLGNAWLIVLNSCIVSVSALIIMQSIFPSIAYVLRAVFGPGWFPTYETQSMITFIAFDVGLLFGFSVLCMRLEKPISPLFPFLSLSILCLTLGDIAYLVTSGAFPREIANLAAIPLYMVRRVLWALGMYWHITIADSNLKVTIEAQEMPYVEWFVWTRLSALTILAAFACTTLVAPAQPDALIALLVLAIIRELATHQEYRLMRLLKRAKAEADSAHAQMEVFIARIIHDLTPPVQSLTSVILESRWPTDQQAGRDIVQRQIRFLETFIHQTRTYLHARTVKVHCALLPLLPLCRTAISTVALFAQQRRITIIQDVKLEEPVVWGNEVALLRVLDNLLTNALGVTPVEGTVIVRITAFVPNHVELAILDQGPGIPLEQQATLFQPYHSIQRASLTEPKGLAPSPTGTGMGLGLAIVKELTAALGGTCGVVSRPGAGSTFYVRLATQEPDHAEV